MEVRIYQTIRGSHFKLPEGSLHCFLPTYRGCESRKISKGMGFRTLLNPRRLRTDEYETRN